MLSTTEYTRYTRQLKLENIGLSGQLKLKNAKVLCIGAGGLGSSLLLYLAAAGVGTLGIVDHDVVELSNLHRQILYQQNQLGQAKAATAKSQLANLNPEITINSYQEKLTSDNVKQLVAEYDIIADCSDHLATKHLLHDYCFTQAKPYVYASISQYTGQCSVYLGTSGPCLHCLFPNSPAALPDCNAAGVLGVLPGLLGIIQATEIIKWILGIGTLLVNRFLMIDILSMQFREYTVEQNPDCPFCIHQPTEVVMQQYSMTVQMLQERLSKNEDLFLLDVRTPEEHQHYNIGGILIPLHELPDRIAELNPSKTIIVYCRSGGRSFQAIQLLLKSGFTSVINLEGGMLAWQALTSALTAEKSLDCILGISS